MHGWLCHFSYMLKFVFSWDCYLVRSEFMWVLSICLLCNHWWRHIAPSEIWMKPNMSLSFSSWKGRTNWGFSFAPYTHNFCWFFKFWGRLSDLGTWWRSCYVCEPPRRETKSLYCQRNVHYFNLQIFLLLFYDSEMWNGLKFVCFVFVCSSNCVGMINQGQH